MKHTVETWIKITKSKARWGKLTLKLFTKKPSCAQNEIAIKLKVDVPAALFDKPNFEVKLDIDPNNYVSSKTNIIDVDMQDNIAEILQANLGINVHVTTDKQDPSLDDKLDIVDQMGK